MKSVIGTSAAVPPGCYAVGAIPVQWDKLAEVGLDQGRRKRNFLGRRADAYPLILARFLICIRGKILFSGIAESNGSHMRRQICQLAHSSWSFVLLAIAASPIFATDHFNLERGIPTTIEDVEPVERRSFEWQGFGRYLWLRGVKNVGNAEPRLAWGIFKKTQLEIATPLLLGKGSASGNGDVQISILRKLWGDQQGAWQPGLALEAEVRLPTGAERHRFKNRVDAGLAVIMKKDVGPHSFHFNAGFDWTGDKSKEDNIKRGVLSIIVGHDMPLTKWLLVVSDVVWSQSDEKGAKDVWLFETGVRTQLTRSLIGAIGMGIGLNRGQETPAFSLTAGFQFSL